MELAVRGNWKHGALHLLWICVHNGMFPNTKLKRTLHKKLERLLRTHLPHKAVYKNQPHTKPQSLSQRLAKSNSMRQPAGFCCLAEVRYGQDKYFHRSSTLQHQKGGPVTRP